MRILGTFVAISLASTGVLDDQQKPPAANAAKRKKVPVACVSGAYQVIARRGTALWIVLVAPACRNEKDMRALGDKLKADLSGESIAIVEIYDNKRAARMSKVMENTRSTGSKDDQFYASHDIGNYSKNTNTGNHRYSIFLEGLNGAALEVSYE